MSGAIPVELGAIPAFREAWQARAFAFVVLLHREGRFAWEDWVRTLAAEIATAPQRADEDAEAAYHRQFLAALEAIAAHKGMTSGADIEARKLAWKRAYLATPHGQAVELSAGGNTNQDDHHHHHHHDHELVAKRQPIAVHPARRNQAATGG